MLAKKLRELIRGKKTRTEFYRQKGEGAKYKTEKTGRIIYEEESETADNLKGG